jgi:hypothetical protein
VPSFSPSMGLLSVVSDIRCRIKLKSATFILNFFFPTRTAEQIFTFDGEFYLKLVSTFQFWLKLDNSNIQFTWRSTCFCEHLECKMFRAVFWVILPCEMIVDRRFRGAYCLHHPWWWQKTALNIILAAVRTWNLTSWMQLSTYLSRWKMFQTKVI